MYNCATLLMVRFDEVYYLYYTESQNETYLHIYYDETFTVTAIAMEELG